MKLRQLGSSSLEVSVVGLGTWAIGGDFWGAVDDAQSIDAIRAGIDAGINLIDTAPAYGAGHSESVVGQAIAGRRDQVIVATKCGIVRTEDAFVRNLKPESVTREVDESLRRLGVDTIDLYQIHWPDEDTPLDDTLEALQRIQEQGKFRYLGVSNFDPTLMQQVMQSMDLVSLQPPYSLLKRDIEAETLPFCRNHGIGVLSYGSLGGGILTGKYDEPPKLPPGDNRGSFYPFFDEPLWSKAQKVVDCLRAIASERNVTPGQVAINWAVAQPGVTTALVGVKTPSQAVENAAAGSWELTESELASIESVYAEAFA